MELINWSLNAIDKVFSSRKRGSGEPACPDGTSSAGYVFDSWSEWKPICLSVLSVEDVEDVYVFGFMIVGFLLMYTVAALIYRKISKSSAHNWMPKLLAINKATFGDVADRVNGLHRGEAQILELLKDLAGRSSEAIKRLDFLAAQSADMLRQIAGLSTKYDELRREVSDLKGKIYAGAYRIEN